MITGFAGIKHFATTSNNNGSWIYTVYNSLWHILCRLSLLCLHQSSGNGFKRRTFPFLCVSELFWCLSHNSSRLVPPAPPHTHNYYVLKETGSRLCMSLNRLSLHKSLVSNKTYCLYLHGTDCTESSVPMLLRAAINLQRPLFTKLLPRNCWWYSSDRCLAPGAYVTIFTV